MSVFPDGLLLQFDEGVLRQGRRFGDTGAVGNRNTAAAPTAATSTNPALRSPWNGYNQRCFMSMVTRDLSNQ